MIVYFRSCFIEMLSGLSLDEEILQWALDNFNVKLLPINIEIKEALHAFNEGMSKDLNKAIRILPSKNMEGFFVSKFIKGE